MPEKQEHNKHKQTEKEKKGKLRQSSVLRTLQLARFLQSRTLAAGFSSRVPSYERSTSCALFPSAAVTSESAAPAQAVHKPLTHRALELEPKTDATLLFGFVQPDFAAGFSGSVPSCARSNSRAFFGAGP